MKNILIPALLFLVGSTHVHSEAQSTAPVAGKDYVEIANGAPLESTDDKVVVEEFFNYICPACYGFEPLFSAWAKKLPSYVKLEHIPASFRPDFEQYSRAFYAAQFFDLVDKTHEAVYEAIHRTHELPAEGDKPDEKRIAAFYAKFGVDAKEFLATMQGFDVSFKVSRAMKHMQDMRIPSTPSIVINGRYLVRGASYQDMLRIADYLIMKEHAGK